MEELRTRWPQFFEPGKQGFHFRAELGDPIIEDVLAFLRTTGREPHWGDTPSPPYEHPTLYEVKGERVWEKSDFDDAEYFRWLVKPIICKGKTLRPDGIFEAEYGTYKGKPIGIVESCWNPICSVDYRATLDAQNFKGLSFRPVQIKSLKPQPLVLWQVWSSVLMPPVLDRVVGLDGEPFDPATSKCCAIDDLYFPDLYRFPKEQIRALEPFDIAVTTEWWGGGPPYVREPALIVSRRFRDWFIKQKIKAEWWPVALEQLP